MSVALQTDCGCAQTDLGCTRMMDRKKILKSISESAERCQAVHRSSPKHSPKPVSGHQRPVTGPGELVRPSDLLQVELTKMCPGLGSTTTGSQLQRNSSVWTS